MRIKIVKRRTKNQGREYIAYSINLPKGLIESIGWDQYNELELETEVRNGKLYITLKPIE